jgi:uncharacterized protein YjiS (DUF1127 family)
MNGDVGVQHLRRRNHLSLLPRMIAWLKLCDERRRQRRALSQLDERLLKDIGITAEEARAEARKLFLRQ